MRIRADKAKKVTAVIAASALAFSLMPAGAMAQTSIQTQATQETNSRWDYFEPVNRAIEVLKAHDWVAAPGMAPDARACMAWLEQQFAALDINQVRVRPDYASLNYVAPVDGTAEDPAGTPGSFTMEVYVYRSWLDALAARHITIGGTLEAVAYQAPVDDGRGDEGDTEAEKPDPGDQNGPSDEGGSDDDQSSGTEGGSDAEQGSDTEKGDEPNDPEPPKKDPVTPPAIDEPPASDPVTTEEAVQIIKQALAQQVAADAAALTIDEDDLQDVSFDDEASAKEAVAQWVRGLLNKEGMIPEGYSYSLGEPEVSLPTEVESGSFKCPVYLEEEVTGTEHPLALDEPVQTLAEVERADDIGAVIGQQDDSRPAREPDLYVEGTIAPRTVKAAGEDDGNDGNATDDEQPGMANHPLAKPDTGNGGIDMINSEEQLKGEGAPRPIKRPEQINGQGRPSSVGSTTTGVQHSSATAATTTIASTDDPMAPFSRLAVVLVFASLVTALICLRRIHKNEA